MVSWGGTYGACATAVHEAQQQGEAVAHCHLRYLNPLPRNLGDILPRFDTCPGARIEHGPTAMMLRARYLIDAVGLCKVQGKPFTVGEVGSENRRNPSAPVDSGPAITNSQSRTARPRPSPQVILQWETGLTIR